MRAIDGDALFDKLFHAWGTEMDGEPVWLEWGGHPQAGWALVRVWSKVNDAIYLTYQNGNTDFLGYVLKDGGKIYRRKPEEGAQK